MTGQPHGESSGPDRAGEPGRSSPGADDDRTRLLALLEPVHERAQHTARVTVRSGAGRRKPGSYASLA
ncbi:MAG: hypothetical protein AAGC55_15610, partial [Myxococcota bacterium]